MHSFLARSSDLPIAIIKLRRCFSPDCKLRDKAEAVRVYRKQAGEGLEAQNIATEIKLLAERRAEVLLAGMERQSGARGVGKKVDFHRGSPLLDDIGLSHKQSHRWQTEATVPDDDFEAYLAVTRWNGANRTNSAKPPPQLRPYRTNRSQPDSEHVGNQPGWKRLATGVNARQLY